MTSKTVIAMKFMSKIFLASLALISTMVIAGCSKPGLTIKGGQVCYSDTKGKAQCLPLGNADMVYLEKGDNGLTLIAHP
jgi:hypothetical protein